MTDRHRKSKVLVFFLLPFILVNCHSKKISLKLPSQIVSNEKIKITKIQKDTIPNYWEILGSVQFPTLNSEGENILYSVTHGIGIKLNKMGLDTIPIRKFEKKTNTYVVFSELVDNKKIYFMVNNCIWVYNLNENDYELISDLSNGIFDKNGLRYDVLHSTFNQIPGIVLDSEHKRLYYPIWTSKKGGKKFIGEINLETKKTEIFDFDRPDVDLSIHRSMQDNTMFVIDSSNMYLAFAYNKIGFKINLINKKIDTLNLQSKFDTAISFDFSKENSDIKDFGERFMKTKIYSSYYGFLTFNPVKKHYYKIFYKQLPENGTNGLKNTLAEKRLVLMIYDKYMHLIKELELDENFNWINHMMPSKNGVILLNASNSGYYNLPNKTLVLSVEYE